MEIFGGGKGSTFRDPYAGTLIPNQGVSNQGETGFFSTLRSGLRETGGFIPPVGVKEKEDDIPAMLSNNEFVFTADAVRGMGDGDVDKGAERMYSMMKKLEDGGRV